MRIAGRIFSALFLLLALSCDSGGPDPIDVIPGERDPDLEKIILPPGFRIDIYAAGVSGARSLAMSENGVLYVGTRGNRVFAVVDRNDDQVADSAYVVAEGLRVPNGVAVRDGDLFVAEIDRILRYSQIDDHLDDPPAPVVVFDGLPSDSHHGWKFIAFGPDGKLYVPIGAPCNICDPGDPYASLWRMNSDGSAFEQFARGIRNTVGFGWNPKTGNLWFTDNQRDHLGDDVPSDELNVAAVSGLHFGYPFFHAGDIPDPSFGEGQFAESFIPPAQKLGPHVAPLGLEFYTGQSFPAQYGSQIFLAEHGSWNRSQKIGYRISLVRVGVSDQVLSYETFADGWLQGQEQWGRPVDLEIMPDGSLLVSDDYKGVVYRISYTGE